MKTSDYLHKKINHLLGIIVLFIYRFRLIFVIGILILFVLSLGVNSRIRIENTLESWFPANDPVIRYYQQVKNTFNIHQSVTLCISGKNSLINTSDFIRLKAIHDHIAKIPGLTQNLSVFSVSASYPRLRLNQKIDNQWTESIRRMMEHSGVIAPLLFSDDCKTTAFFLSFDEKVIRDKPIIEKLEKIREEFSKDGFTIHIAGMQIVYEELNRKTLSDFVRLALFILILLSFTAVFFLRNIKDILFLFVINLVTSVTAMGIFALFNGQLNMVLVLFPILTLILSTSSVLHILHTWKNTPGHNQKTRVYETLIKTLSPCFLSSFTTMIGFISLTFSPSKIIYDLGIYTSAGILASFIITMILSIAYLSIKKEPPSPVQKTIILPEILSRFPLRFRYLIVVISLGILTVSILLTVRLEPDTHSIKMLGTSNGIYRDNLAIEQKFGYTLPVEWTLTVSDLTDDHLPEILTRIRQFQNEIQTIDPEYYSFAATDLIQETPLFFNPDHFPMPDFTDSKKTLLYFRILKQFPVMKDFYDSKTRSFRMIILIPMGSSREISKRLAELKRTDEQIFALPRYETQFTGYTAVYSRIIDYVTRSMTGSILFAVICILGVMFVLYPHPLLFLFVMIVNSLPIFTGLGLIKILNLDLDITALTVAAIAAGLVVDDTIHFLYHYHEHKPYGPDALLKTIRQVTLPMISTSVILIAGFFPLIFSSLAPLKIFGLLMCVIVLIANLCDIWLMPALIRIFRKS